MAQNKHLEHLEDELLNEGVNGAKAAIEILEKMGRFLTGETGKAKVTTKWDGAPAVVVGTDPEDGKFFVGTKSVFNKENPKIAKSEADIRTMYQGGVVDKLLDSFRFLKPLNIRGVLQGDLLFTPGDKKSEKIKGEKFITFRPNTITYAAVPTTPLGRRINSARLGIVFHTKYEGQSLPEMNSNFNVSRSDFGKHEDVWAELAEFQDISGAANMDRQDKIEYDKALNRAKGSLTQSGGIMNKIQSGKRTLEIDTEFKKFFNGYVKEGRPIPSVDRAYREFAHHLGKEYDKAIQKNKTLKAQADKAGKFIDVIDFIEANERQFRMLIATYMNIQYCKNIIVNKLKKVSSLNLFVNMGDHYESTAPEGFVAITGSKAVKLVDRMEFSRLNFVVPKVW